ncbi:MAG: glycosyltransferase [Devosia sp.]|uniref:glycosyltransferase family 2 protein n=1 Tax=Devosia sp. TaxID=1871048 RepID=UPI001A070E4E|nr:glycosyltransferase family 2 protein [Devosia sp.]MBF0679009.1 glycosyltransferase [Devosia sp.]
MSVSVLIKTLNEADNIAATIESVLAAIGPEDEVIIADSGSRDATVEIAGRYGVKVVQIAPDEAPSCGLGPQLGFQYSKGEFLCLMDGDMLLDPKFLREATAFLRANPKVAGVGGHVEEMNLENLEFARRKSRGGAEYQAGRVDRLNGGGLYRRAAVEEAGYLSDRNLHGYEEFDLGVRLRAQGWQLHRLDRRFVQHFGYRMNAYALLLRRWRSKYLRGVGELLRAGLGKSHWNSLLRELPELRLWAGVYGGLALMLALLIFVPNKLLAVGLCILLAAFVVLAMSLKHKSLKLGAYAVTAWLFMAAALPLGFFARRRDPQAWIESRVVADAGN